MDIPTWLRLSSFKANLKGVPPQKNNNNNTPISEFDCCLEAEHLWKAGKPRSEIPGCGTTNIASVLMVCLVVFCWCGSLDFSMGCKAGLLLTYRSWALCYIVCLFKQKETNRGFRLHGSICVQFPTKTSPKRATSIKKHTHTIPISGLESL